MSRSPSSRVLDALRALVADATPGAPLPSVRALCERLTASPLTVQRAMTTLSREGHIVTLPSRGSFVAGASGPAPRAPDHAWQSLALGARPPYADDMDVLLAPVPDGEISFRGGYPDASLQPVAALQAALARASRRPGVWGRQPPEGNPELRAWFAREASSALSAADTLIVPGGQAALAVTIRALCPPGAPLLVESPTYVGAVAVARAAGVVPVPVPSDRDGVRPDLLAAAFRATGARVFFTQPTFANPNGSVLAPDRRAAVLAAAEAAGAFVLEDDFAHDLAFAPRPPPLVSLDPGRVVYIRSLTKSAAAGLRIAAVCATGPVATRIRSARSVEDLFVSGPLQEAGLELVTSPAWPRHLRALTRALVLRRDAAVEALRQDWPAARLALVPDGGYHLWVELPPGVDDLAFTRAAAAVGVHVSAGRRWFPAEPTGSFVRLSYAAADEAALREGIRRLGRL
ncbi:MAG: PLP-dependent aminotransferase family protein [Myxococcota bacterium]